jgi:hypothetical protein
MGEKLKDPRYARSAACERLWLESSAATGLRGKGREKSSRMAEGCNLGRMSTHAYCLGMASLLTTLYEILINPHQSHTFFSLM